MTEYVRQALNRTIVKPYLTDDNVINVITVHPNIEEMIGDSIQKSNDGSVPVLQSKVITSIFDSINAQHSQLQAQGVPHVILTAPKNRPAMRNLISFNFPDIAVLSLNEIPNEVGLETVGMIEIADQ